MKKINIVALWALVILVISFGLGACSSEKEDGTAVTRKAARDRQATNGTTTNPELKNQPFAGLYDYLGDDESFYFEMLSFLTMTKDTLDPITGYPNQNYNLFDPKQLGVWIRGLMKVSGGFEPFQSGTKNLSSGQLQVVVNDDRAAYKTSTSDFLSGLSSFAERRISRSKSQMSKFYIVALARELEIPGVFSIKEALFNSRKEML